MLLNVSRFLHTRGRQLYSSGNTSLAGEADYGRVKLGHYKGQRLVSLRLEGQKRVRDLFGIFLKGE